MKNLILFLIFLGFANLQGQALADECGIKFFETINTNKFIENLEAMFGSLEILSKMQGKKKVKKSGRKEKMN